MNPRDKKYFQSDMTFRIANAASWPNGRRFGGRAVAANRVTLKRKNAAFAF
jgi:hypothetical protein